MWYNISCSVVNTSEQKCRSGGTADATDSKSVELWFMRVRPPLWVPKKSNTNRVRFFLFYNHQSLYLSGFADFTLSNAGSQ